MYQHKRRQARIKKFLGRINKLMPWKPHESIIEPCSPKAGKGRRTYPLLIMLRIHRIQ